MGVIYYLGEIDTEFSIKKFGLFVSSRAIVLQTLDFASGGVFGNLCI